MTSHNNYSFTTIEQELVLKASLLEREEAINAWQEWVSSTDIEGYHHDVFRLLPLLYHNLKKHNVDHPFMKRLKGVYKMFWYQNKQLLHNSSKILNKLHNQGIETLLFKGAPLSINYYKNIGLRPMNDIDVLVKEKDIQKAITFFEKEGWEPQLKPVRDHLKYHNGVGFTDRNGNEFDIHWHPLIESIWEENHNDFWENSVPLLIDGMETRAFSASDLLLHTIVHGIRWNPEPPVRWIPDSVYIINFHGEKIDWERFISLTKKYRLHLKIKKSINYLYKVYDAKIPENVLMRLNEIKTSKADKLEYEYLKHDPEENFLCRPAGNLIYHIICFRDITGKSLTLKDILKFPDYLRYRYGCPNILSLFTLFVSLSFRKIFMNIKSLIFCIPGISSGNTDGQ